MKIGSDDLLLCVFAIGGFGTGNGFPFVTFAIILIWLIWANGQS